MSSLRKSIREEDMADKWLKKHDPYYRSKNGHKKKSEDRPYETLRQEETRANTEIPLSCLNPYQRRSIRGVMGEYDENGNFIT